MNREAFHFLQEAVGKPGWIETITEGEGDKVVALARENGYQCDLNDLKKVAGEIVHGTGEPQDVSQGEIKEAEAGSVGFDKRGGYGSDSGFAMISGLAAALLKK